MRDLSPLYPQFQNEDPPIAEAWLTGDQCPVATGPFAGRKLGEAWGTMPPEWTGQRCQGEKQIPLLVKFLFPGDRPSLQVHPDDAYASRHEVSAGEGKRRCGTSWQPVPARNCSTA